MVFDGGRISARTSGILMVTTAGVLWSTIGIGVRAMDSATPFQIVFHRATGQIPFVLAIVAIRYRGRIIEAFRSIGVTGIVGALLLALAYLTGVYAVANTTVANAVFTFSMAPVFAAVLGWLILREPVSRLTGASIAVSMVGIVVLTWGQTDGGQLAGNVAGLLGAVTYAGFAVALRSRKHVDMMPMIVVSGVMAAGIAAAVAGDVAIEPGHQFIAIGLGAGALGVGLMLFTIGSRLLTTAELPLLAMTETILAPVWVWIWFNEPMSVQTIIGGVIILTAVIVQSGRFAPWRPARVRRTGAIADASAAIHVWLAVDDGRPDPFGPPDAAAEVPSSAAVPPEPRSGGVS